LKRIPSTRSERSKKQEKAGGGKVQKEIKAKKKEPRKKKAETLRIRKDSGFRDKKKGRKKRKLRAGDPSITG